MVNNIFLYKRFIGVKKINGHSEVNFSFKARTIAKTTKISEDFTKTFPKCPRTGMEGMDCQKEIALPHVICISVAT